MMYKEFVKIIVTGLFCSGLIIAAVNSTVAGDIIDQKKELEKIQNEIESSRQNLDSLRAHEKQVQKEISDYEQRESLNKTIVDRLNKQLRQLRKEIENSKNSIENSEKHFSSSLSRYLKNLKYYYTGTKSRSFFPGEEIDLERQAFERTVYLRALATYDKGELTQASEWLGESEKLFANLVDEEKSVDKVRKNKRSEYTIISSQRQKKEKDLSKLRREKEDEADRLVTLTEAARQMEDLIARLEMARQAREGGESYVDFDFETGNFLSYKGRLPAPIRGQILNSYGWKTDKTTYLKSFSPGIEIKGKSNDAVKAVAPGVVAYTGYIRGYSNFVIIEHEDGYYTTYAGLDNLTVVQYQIVGKTEKIGTASTGIIKFELRKGRQPLDPVEWVQIDSFK